MQATSNVNLHRLSILLKAAALPSQIDIARACNVDQGFVSRAANGKLRRVTPRVDRLWRYVNMRLQGTQVPEKIEGAVRTYLEAGGDPELLRRQIELLQAAQTSGPRRG